MEKSREICLNSDELKKISIPSTGFAENYVVKILFLYHYKLRVLRFEWRQVF